MSKTQGRSAGLAQEINTYIAQGKHEGMGQEELLDVAWSAAVLYAQRHAETTAGIKSIDTSTPGGMGIEVSNTLNDETRKKLDQFVNQVMAGNTPSDEEYPF